MKCKKASVLIYSLMLATLIIILALALAPATTEFTERAMNDTVGDNLGMNCSSPDTDFTRATCYAADLTPFYFIASLLFIGGAVITAKIIFL